MARKNDLRPGSLVRAAAHRRRVRLVDNKQGVLVYSPGDHAHGPVRHGDLTKSGVRIDGSPPSFVTAVEPSDIVEVF